MLKKREMFYIIALVVSLLTNVGMAIYPKPEPEAINYYTNSIPFVASIDESKNNNDSNMVKEEDTNTQQEEKQKVITRSEEKKANPTQTPIQKITTIEPKININTADISQLIRLPGIGEATAKKIIAYRTNKGQFKRVQDLMLITGIGEKTFADIKNYVVIE